MKVYLSEPIAPSAYARLAERFELTDSFDRPEELDGVLTRKVAVTGDVIRRAERLKVISVHGIGLDSVDLEAARQRGIPVLNVPGGGCESVAELAVGQLLALSRKMKAIGRGMAEGRFQRFGDPALAGTELYGKKLGLIGAGSIACRVGDIMRAAFSCRIYCYHPRRTGEELAALGMEKVPTLEELFRSMDMISVHVPLTAETRGMVGRALLENANPGLLLVNTARGGVVDEDDLYQALTEGWIQGAASDVFVTEPPDRDMPLLGLDNFIATMHVGGSTRESLDQVGNRAVDNIIRVLCPEEAES